jgi:hypothetical protein
MSIQKVPGTDLTYHLVAYDKHGDERRDDPDGLMSERARIAARDSPVTDVFIVSHGWKGDVSAAKEQYDSWIGAMAACTADRARVRAQADFAALIVGFHWPSLPWGDEEFGTPGVSFGTGAAAPGPATAEDLIERLVDRYADRIADTPRARASLHTIVGAAAKGTPAVTLPPDVAAAYAELATEAALVAQGPAGAPGMDAEPFDPARSFANAKQAAALPGAGGPAGPGAAVAFGGPSLGGLLSPLRQLSFWKMKDRARSVGESAGFTLLRSLQDAVPQGRTVRFHLVGHSFGCIVVSGMLNGPNGQGVLARPVDTLTLLQGALSLWSYCDNIPDTKNAPGYFRGLVHDKKVQGPILTTRSKRDTAVGKFYPIAAGVRLQVAFGPNEFPKYGGLGAFGIQGGGLSLVDGVLQGVTHDYKFQPGVVYNFECTGVIKDGGGASGAHSDIAKPEVAHAMWDAVIGARPS